MPSMNHLRSHDPRSGCAAIDFRRKVFDENSSRVLLTYSNVLMVILNNNRLDISRYCIIYPHKWSHAPLTSHGHARAGRHGRDPRRGADGDDGPGRDAHDADDYGPDVDSRPPMHYATSPAAAPNKMT